MKLIRPETEFVLKPEKVVRRNVEVKGYFTYDRFRRFAFATLPSRYHGLVAAELFREVFCLIFLSERSSFNFLPNISEL